MNPVTDEQIQQLLDYANKVQADRWAQNSLPWNPPVITAEKAKRYARLVITQDGGKGQRCAYGFLDLTTGDLFKPASWKAPEKNFARGNIHTNQLECCREYRIT